MATNTHQSDADRSPHTIEADAEILAIVDETTHDDAVAAFWEGANHDDEFIAGIGDGLDTTVTIDRESVQTDTEGTDHRAVELDATLTAVLDAVDPEDAVEGFTEAINNRFVFEVELIGGVGVTVSVDRESIHAEEAES